MEPRIILEQQPLKAILNAINSGVIGVENYDNLLILSKDKPEIFIKHVTINIDTIVENILDSEMKKIVEEIESEFYDYIVFTIDRQEKVLMNMSLLEYMLIHMNENKETDFLDTSIWNLIDLTIQ